MRWWWSLVCINARLDSHQWYCYLGSQWEIISKPSRFYEGLWWSGCHCGWKEAAGGWQAVHILPWTKNSQPEGATATDGSYALKESLQNPLSPFKHRGHKEVKQNVFSIMAEMDSEQALCWLSMSQSIVRRTAHKLSSQWIRAVSCHPPPQGTGPV